MILKACETLPHAAGHSFSDRIGGLTVVFSRPGEKVCRQFPALGLDTLVLGRQLEIHTAPLCSDASLRHVSEFN